jgi:quercetin dioxygenase-like cupin family protein
MAISHAESGQIIDARPLGTALTKNITRALIKTQNLEVIHMVMPAGKEIAEHKVNGDITVQCLEGQITFTAGGKTQELHQGQMLYLNRQMQKMWRCLAGYFGNRTANKLLAKVLWINLWVHYRDCSGNNT